jgi:hypothetical protein
MAREKKNRKYASATMTEGIDYRTIAETMTSQGETMNHATARNVLMGAMERIAIGVGKHVNVDLSMEDAMRIARDPTFQGAVADIVSDLYALGGMPIPRP